VTLDARRWGGNDPRKKKVKSRQTKNLKRKKFEEPPIDGNRRWPPPGKKEGESDSWMRFPSRRGCVYGKKD